jgi:hypothetical protein
MTILLMKIAICKTKINLILKILILLKTIIQFKYYLKKCVYFLGFIIKWSTKIRKHHIKSRKTNSNSRKVKSLILSKIQTLFSEN